MKRLFWFGLGVVAGARMRRVLREQVDAFLADPIRETDRLVRLATPHVQRLVRSARTTIEV